MLGIMIHATTYAIIIEYCMYKKTTNGWGWEGMIKSNYCTPTKGGEVVAAQLTSATLPYQLQCF